jgi:hypothetical protein
VWGVMLGVASDGNGNHDLLLQLTGVGQSMSQ